MKMSSVQLSWNHTLICCNCSYMLLKKGGKLQKTKLGDIKPNSVNNSNEQKRNNKNKMKNKNDPRSGSNPKQF